MQFCISTVITTVFAVITIATPSPLRGGGTKVGLGGIDLATSLEHTLHARSGVINVNLGATHTNIGDFSHGDLYNQVYQTIKKACPFDRIVGCSHKVDVFTVWYGHPGTPRAMERLTLTVDDAVWNGNDKIYNLLVGSISGAVERATYHKDSCYTLGELKYCNTASSVAVSFPGHHMNVRLSTPNQTGNFDCWKIKETVAGYLDTLQPEIQEVLGDEDLYTNVDCVV